MDSPAGRGGRRESAGRKPIPEEIREESATYGLRQRKGKAEEIEVEVNRKRIKLHNEMNDSKRKAGDLVPFDEVRREFTEYVNIVNMTLETLPDIIERNTGISGDVVAEIQLILDRTRRALQEKLESNFGAP